ncbi:MAG: hypothetical protein JNL88_04360 [Bacteroidia bacterium]|nr:hypothetical protein [Bacteroidia bacterium]
MNTHYFKVILLFFVVACSGEAVKEKINQAGDVAGQTVGEFASGVKGGVEKAFEINITLSDGLKQQGLSLGKVSLKDSSGNDHVLTVYTIFGKAFNGAVTAKAFDHKDSEMGRVKLEISALKDEARFLEFRFDPRTNIDTDSRIVLE